MLKQVLISHVTYYLEALKFLRLSLLLSGSLALLILGEAYWWAPRADASNVNEVSFVGAYSYNVTRRNDTSDVRGISISCRASTRSESPCERRFHGKDVAVEALLISGPSFEHRVVTSIAIGGTTVFIQSRQKILAAWYEKSVSDALLIWFAAFMIIFVLQQLPKVTCHRARSATSAAANPSSTPG